MTVPLPKRDRSAKLPPLDSTPLSVSEQAWHEAAILHPCPQPLPPPWGPHCYLSIWHGHHLDGDEALHLVRLPHTLSGVRLTLQVQRCWFVRGLGCQRDVNCL